MLDARDAMLAADRMRFGGANHEGHVGRLRQARHGQGRLDPERRLRRRRAELRRRRRPTNADGHASRTSGAGKVYVGRLRGPGDPGRRHRRKTTELEDTARVRAGHATRCCYVSPSRGFKRFTLDRRRRRRQPDRRAIAATRNLAAGGERRQGARRDARARCNAELPDRRHRGHQLGRRDRGQRRRRRTRSSRSTWPASVQHGQPGPGQRDAQPGAGRRRPTSRSRRRPGLRVAVHRAAPVRPRGVRREAATSAGAKWKRFYTSQADAFPAIAPAPGRAEPHPASFDVPDTRAAAVRLVALENQCTGFAGYAGEQDNDPPTTPTARRRPTAARSCTPPSCRCSDVDGR